MKTKIIYISGNEIFDMNDIRCAFEEVRKALNLDQETVLFGVPVDKDDAELSTATTEIQENITESVETPITEEPEIITESVEEFEEPEEKIIEITEPVKKRGRPKKIETIEENIEPQPTAEEAESVEPITEDEEKIIPILSILSSNDDDEEQETPTETVDEAIATEQVIEEEIINTETTDDEAIQDEEETNDDSKSDLEKLLSGVKPLDETEEEIKTLNKKIEEPQPEEENVDLTLEKLASEFIQTQDKIVEDAKSATPGKISKLRRFVPFKKKQPSEDNVFGDLFGWAGQAANDDEFSVPGFFTRSKK